MSICLARIGEHAVPFPPLHHERPNVLGGDEPAEKCNGLINRTETGQQSGGAFAQLTRRDPLASRENIFTAGGGFETAASISRSRPSSATSIPIAASPASTRSATASAAARSTASLTTHASISTAPSRRGASSRPIRCQLARACTCRSPGATTTQRSTIGIAFNQAAVPDLSMAITASAASTRPPASPSISLDPSTCMRATTKGAAPRHPSARLRRS